MNMGERVYKEKILIIEDDFLIAEALKEHLLSFGYEVVGIISDENLSLKYIEKTEPDLILLDIYLKDEMNGIRIAEKINKRYEIPFIFLTAYGSDDLIQKIKTSQPAGFILKPYNPLELRAVIESTLYRSRITRELHKRNRWITTILMNLQEAVISTDESGLITYVNKACCELLGKQQEQLLYQTLENVLPFRDFQGNGRITIKQLFSSHRSQYQLTLKKDRAKKPIYLEVQTSPLTDEYHTLQGYIIILRDISETVNMLQSLTAARQLQERQIAALSFINSISEKVHRARSLNYLLKIALDHICQFTRARAGLICLNPDEFQDICVTREFKYHEIPVDFNRKLFTTLLQEIFSKRKKRDPLLLEPFKWLPLLMPLIGPDSFQNEKLLAIPLYYKNQITGYTLLFLPESSTIEKEIFNIFSSFGSSVGLALINFLSSQHLSQEIKKRKRSEENALNLLKRLTIAQEIGKMAFLEWDLVRNKVIYPENFFKILNLPYKRYQNYLEIIKKSCHPDDLEYALATFQSAIRNHQSFELAHRTNPERGAVKWVRVKGDWIFNEKGEAAKLIGTITDITEVVRLQVERDKLQEQFEKAFMLSPNLISITRLEDGKIINVNHAFLNALEYKSEEVIGKTTLELNIWATPEKREEFTRELKEKQLVENLDALLRTKSGTLRHFLLNSTVIQMGTDNESFIITTGLDITERKKAQEQLWEMERRFRTMLENIQLLSIMLNSTGEITFVNDFLCGLTGWKREELLGTPWLKLVAEEHQRFVKQNLLSRLEEFNYLPHIKYSLQLKDGRRRLISWNNTLLFDPNGNVIGLASIGSDITEEQRAKRALEEKERFIRSIYNTTPACIGVVKDGLITEINNFSCQLLEYGRQELIGQKIEVLFPGRTAGERNTLFYPGRVRGTQAVETTFQKKSGGSLYVLLSTAAIEPEDPESEIIFSAIDITPLKKAQEEIRRYQEELGILARHLQQVSEQERKSISRELHDDLGQALVAMKMEIALLRGLITPEIPQSFTRVLNSSLTTLEEMLDRTIESNRRIISQLRPEVLDSLGLKDAIEWYCSELQKGPARNLKFLLQLEEIHLTEEQELSLYRVFQEAVTNAIKHSGSPIIRVKLTHENNSILFEVEDQGKGFNVDKVDISRHYGLLSMRSRIKEQQGEFSISSTPGRGTLIRAILPYSEEKQ